MNLRRRSHGATTWSTFDGGAKDGTVAPVATGRIAECHRSRGGGRIAKVVRYEVARTGGIPPAARQRSERSAASRNRVMRGPGVTQGAKRSQGARRPRD